ncbi:MAG: hypothetical protein P8Z37_19790, partial [Acidobacteriota bacterium]
GDTIMKNKKQFLTLAAAASLVFGIGSVYTQNGFSAPNQNRSGFVDENGDGICDITGVPIGSGTQAGKNGQGNRKGPGDGTGNLGSGPQDGTGYGAQSGKRMGPQNGSQAGIGQGNRAGSGSRGQGSQGRRGGRR